NLFDARQRLGFDRAKPGEIDLRPVDDRKSTAGCRCSSAGRRSRQSLLDEAAYIVKGNAALWSATFDARQVNAQFAREFAHRGRCIRQLVQRQILTVILGW